MFRQRINPVTIHSKIIFSGAYSILSLVALGIYFISLYSCLGVYCFVSCFLKRQVVSKREVTENPLVGLPLWLIIMTPSLTFHPKTRDGISFPTVPVEPKEAWVLHKNTCPHLHLF